jgi:hypothetical protein
MLTATRVPGDSRLEYIHSGGATSLCPSHGVAAAAAALSVPRASPKAGPRGGLFGSIEGGLHGACIL